MSIQLIDGTLSTSVRMPFSFWEAPAFAVHQINEAMGIVE